MGILGRLVIKNPISFNWETRSVLALLYMGYRSHKEIGKLLNCSSRNLPKLQVFTERLLTSRNRVIQTCLKHGLPACCTVEVPHPNLVRCKRCGAMVFMIPCVRCGCSSWRPDEDAWLGVKPKEPEHPTSCSPGSPEKIEVMRQRVSRGESPFHEGDAIKLR